MSQRTGRLPDTEYTELQRLREAKDLPGLRLRVRALRDAGWTLRSIGEPLEASRSSVQMWERAPLPPGTPLPEVAAPPRVRRERVVRLYPDVPTAIRPKLRDLSARARAVRGWTADDAPSKVAARELDDLLKFYSRECGVPVKTLARHCDVTYRAIAARLERADARTGSSKVAA